MPRVVSGDRRRSFFADIKVHFRRMGVILLNALLGNSMFFYLIGFFNKNVFDKPIKTIFILYPANEKYTKAYVYPWYARSMKWKPRLVGVTRQNGKWGLIFGISATESEFKNPENIINLQMVEVRLERIRITIGATQKTFAGILPSILSAKGVIRNSVEREVTVKAVFLALEKVRQSEQLLENTPVLILGGSGFIGSALKKAGNGNFFSFDLGKEDRFRSFAEENRGRKIIVLNLTKKGVLSFYLSFLWPEVIVVNEVYPEPSESELAKIKSIGAKCYHIIGVKGKAWPAFPRGYAGGIPCCASFWPGKGQNYEVLIKRM